MLHEPVEVAVQAAAVAQPRELVTLDSLRQTQTQLSAAERLVQTDELAQRAAQLAQGVRSLRFPDPYQALRVTMSVGAAMCDAASDWSTWYSETDSALYQAKGTGGDTWKVDG